MIQYNFIPQTGNPKIKGIGLLTIDHDEAVFWEGDGGKDSKILGTLNHPEITFINSSGIFIKGYAPDGIDKTGRKKYKYMEWYCSFIIKTM